MKYTDEQLLELAHGAETWLKEMRINGPNVHGRKWGRGEFLAAIRTVLDSKPPAVEQKPVFQWRTKGCADWYDGHPDPEDGGGPYETRTLFMAQPEQDSGKKGGA